MNKPANFHQHRGTKASTGLELATRNHLISFCQEVEVEVLIIDDNSENKRLTEDFILNSVVSGTCTFRHASKIEDAKELVQARLFHFVIIDPAFSREFGLPLIKTIKDYSPSTKLIAFSHCSIRPCTAKCEEQCLHLGADCHLDKVTTLGLPCKAVRGFSNSSLKETSYKTITKKTFSSIIRGDFSNNTRLKTPSFLRAKGH